MSWVVKPVEEKHTLGTERLRGLIRATCLRRTKQKTLSSGILKLPPRSEKIHEVKLHEDDQVLYDAVKKRSAEMAAGLEKRPVGESSSQGKGKNILLLINSLRLICDHGEQLLPDAVKRSREENSASSFDLEMQQIGSGSCSVCEGEIDSSISGTEGQDSICVNCATSEKDSLNTTPQADPLGKKGMLAYRSASSERSGSAKVSYRPSAKVLALLGNLEQERAATRSNHRPRKRYILTLLLLKKMTCS
jgi:SNF2 family DNA or RNA helicase